MTTKAGFISVLVLQAATIALLLCLVFEKNKVAGHLRGSPKPVEPDASVHSLHGPSGQVLQSKRPLQQSEVSLQQSEHALQEFKNQFDTVHETVEALPSSEDGVVRLSDELLQGLKRVGADGRPELFDLFHQHIGI